MSDILIREEYITFLYRITVPINVWLTPPLGMLPTFIRRVQNSTSSLSVSILSIVRRATSFFRASLRIVWCSSYSWACAIPTKMIAVIITRDFFLNSSMTNMGNRWIGEFSTLVSSCHVDGSWFESFLILMCFLLNTTYAKVHTVNLRWYSSFSCRRTVSAKNFFANIGNLQPHQSS